MTIALSTIAYGAIDQMFAGLDRVLGRAEADAAARGIEENVYLDARLAPDMYHLKKQVLLATELPLRALRRRADQEAPAFDDDETSFADLRARITRIHAMIRDVPKDAIDGDLHALVTFPAGANNMTLSRLAFVQMMLLPNLYFHVTAAYAILRHLGVEIGKRDFLAAPD